MTEPSDPLVRDHTEGDREGIALSLTCLFVNPANCVSAPDDGVTAPYRVVAQDD
jgi:hypothetical protein